jgi:hypothetical protein
MTSPSSISSLYDLKVTEGRHEEALQIKTLQSSSSFIGRVKWAAEDRSKFFSAVRELTEANDLLESLLRIKSLDDPTFLTSNASINRLKEFSILSTRETLETLHQDLLAINPASQGMSISLKLTLDNADKDIYADYVDTMFEKTSSVFSLQAHPKGRGSQEDMSYYLLAEAGIARVEGSSVNNLLRVIGDIDETADPNFHCLGVATNSKSRTSKVRLYQDKTSKWTKTQTLAKALEDRTLQDISFQRHYSQLGLFMAFSYAVLPFTFKGKAKFPQPSNYIYYDQPSIDDPSDDDSEQQVGTATINVHTEEELGQSNTALEEIFQDLYSPYINFNFGSRPANVNTKALGKRAGFTAPTNNALVALGLLLYQIGSWQHIPLSNIIQMRKEALDKPHDLIRLSGVEFADITRTCLNWRETGPDGKQFNTEEMLMKVYARLDEYNRSLQALI